MYKKMTTPTQFMLIRGGGTGGAIAPPIFASSSTLAPPIIAGSSTSWGCYSYPNFFDLPAGLLMLYKDSMKNLC